MRPPAKEPTLSSLIAEDKGLRIYCECNGVLRILSPLEAVASYGGNLENMDNFLLAVRPWTPHISLMASHPTTSRSSSFKSGSVAGHSAATGGYVLKPVSKKGSSITVRAASKAAKDSHRKSK